MNVLYFALFALGGFASGVYFSRPTRAELYSLREQVLGLYSHVETVVKNVGKAL